MKKNEVYLKRDENQTDGTSLDLEGERHPLHMREREREREGEKGGERDRERERKIRSCLTLKDKPKHSSVAVG